MLRIIPRLDIKGPNLVKGIHLEGLRVLGKPEEFAKYYYENGADELLFMDVVASLYERNSLHDIVSKTAKAIFIPLTVGGGIRTIDDIKEVLRAGADKVALNTAAIKNPNIIKEAAKKFGSSTIVIAIEAIKQTYGNYLAYTDNGREHTGVEVVDWAIRVAELGAGEIIITSVDKEGTGEGFDIELTKKISDSVSIPVIAHGGSGTKKQVEDIIKKSSVEAVAISSLFHYNYVLNQQNNLEQGKEGNIEFLKSGNSFKRIAEPININDLKKYLSNSGIDCRV